MARPKAKRSPSKMVLRLYVAGTSDRSMRAIVNAREMLDEHIAGRYELEVIDLLQQPTLARDDQIVAVPTLIKRLPEPLQRFIGDLSDKRVTIIGMDLRRRGCRPRRRVRKETPRQAAPAGEPRRAPARSRGDARRDPQRAGRRG